MPHVSARVEDGVAVVVLCRGKVNALDEPTIDELNERFRELEAEEAVRAVVFPERGSSSPSGSTSRDFSATPNPNFRVF